jgi:cytochrome c-type biogenesis protein CcmH/NrfG
VDAPVSAPTVFRKTARVVAPTAVAAFLVACAAAGPPTSETRAANARTALERGDLDRADLELKLAIQADPLDARSHRHLAGLLARRGERDQAIVGYRRALTIDPADASAAYNAGTLFLMRGDAAPAASLLESAAAIRPDDPRTYNNLAKAYFLAGLPEYSFAAYEETLRHDPSNVVALRGLTTIADAAGLGDAAAEYRRRLAAVGAGATPPSSIAANPTGPAAGSPREPATAAGQDGGASGGGDEHVDSVRALLKDLRFVKVERRGDRIVLAGWTTGTKEREVLARVLAYRTDVLDLTTDDSGDPRRMIEVDATIFVVIELDTTSVGFNFLRLVDTTFSYFATDHSRSGTGFTAPGSTGVVAGEFQQGWMFAASVDYDVNIANAAQERVAVLARPHLTTLSGTPAKFLTGGEYVFRVSGNISGDIKPYPFGTTLDVTPTILRDPAEDGRPRIHMKVDAGRTSVLGVLTAQEQTDATVFDKVEISSEAVLGVGQTLVLSGLSQRERRTGESGVPILSSIPLLKYFFSQSTTAESNTAVVVLLTPRDPGYVDQRQREEIAKFTEKRRAFIEARLAGEEGMRKFVERYPDWYQLSPNRFATHFFLMNTSDLYRAVSGQDLATEALEFDLLGSRKR